MTKMDQFRGGDTLSGNPVRVVDADCHVLEPPRALYDLIEPKFRERAPRIVEIDGAEYWEGEPMLGQAPVGGGRPRASGLAGMAGVARWSDQSSMDGGAQLDLKYTEANPGGFFPGPRLEEFQEEGIDQGVFFPTGLLGFNPDVEYAQALARAYNEWLSEFCRFSPDRLFGACATHLGDPEAAAQEVRRCASELGFKAAFLRPCLYIEGTQWWQDVYEPFWAACEECDIALAFHPLSTDRMAGSARYFRIGDGVDKRATFLRAPFVHPVDAMFTLGSLICGGVLERHPRLRVGFVECSGGWVVPLLDRLDHRFDHLGQTMRDELTLRPSEYFQRQCWISFDPDEISLAFGAEHLGADRVMVGSDFPHPDAFYPDFIGMVDSRIGSVSAAGRRQILGESARAFYQLP